MALGIAINKRDVTSAAKRRKVTFTMDNAYAVGGYVVAAASFELGTIDAIEFASGCSSAGHVPFFDKTNSKIKFFVTGTGSTVALQEAAANLASLNNATIDAIVEGDQVNNG